MNTGPRSYDVSTQMPALEHTKRPIDGTQPEEGIRVVSTPTESIGGVVLLFGAFNCAMWLAWYLAQPVSEVQPW